MKDFAPDLSYLLLNLVPPPFPVLQTCLPWSDVSKYRSLNYVTEIDGRQLGQIRVQRLKGETWKGEEVASHNVQMSTRYAMEEKFQPWEAKRPGLEFQPSYLLATWLWTGYPISKFKFSTLTTGITLVSIGGKGIIIYEATWHLLGLVSDNKFTMVTD